MSEKNENNDYIVKVEDMAVYFPIHMGMIRKKKVGDVKAVDGVTFNIRKGETLGLVGESGCGKTTTGRAILQLQRPTAGHVFFEDTDLTQIEEKTIRPMRSEMQMIFQDPFGSLNPRFPVGEIIGEPIKIHNLAGSRGEYRSQVKDLMRIVGLNPGAIDWYPHEFSGGQRQRIGVARALSVKPKFIVCDEPVSALDVSIQAQIINLLEELQEEFSLTYLFIAHDLAVVRHISDRIAVMYLGNIVEIATRRDLYRKPLHPYTRALLSAVPIPDPEVEAQREHILLKGEVPSPFNPPPGCKFHPRCQEADMGRCDKDMPELVELPGEEHWVSCHKGI
jgi:oligopeptide transport system ATP-binding protein